MKVQIKKKVVELMGAMLLAFSALGCTEADQVSRNISKEADNFNVTRKLTVLNARTDTVLLELTGTFALGNSSANELEVIIETDEGKYQKDYVYLMSIPCMWLRTSPALRLINIIMKSTSCQNGDLKPLTASNLRQYN